MELKRVVVTGIGALTPIGNTAPEFWNSLINGVSGASPITRFDASLFKTKFACEVKNLNVEDFIDRKEMRRMDRYSNCLLVSPSNFLPIKEMCPFEEISRIIANAKVVFPELAAGCTA